MISHGNVGKHSQRELTIEHLALVRFAFSFFPSLTHDKMIGLITVFVHLFLQFPTSSAYNFTEDYARLKSRKDCVKKCYFDQELITLATIDKWPIDCDTVCGIITLNQDSDVPTETLKKKFRKMYWFYGGIRIDNTSFTDLSFLRPIYNYCRNVGISISNNSKLVDVTNLGVYEPAANCQIQVIGNPKLDAKHFCNNDNFSDKWEIRDNKVDCDCRGQKLSSKNLEKYQTCEFIGGKLVIADLTENEVPIAPKVKKIAGTLEVKNTALKDLSFFESLHQICYTSNETDGKVIINVHDNPEMRRLGIRSLKMLGYYWIGLYKLNFENLHPEFCVTVAEMSMFIDYYVTFNNIHAGYCTDTTWYDKDKNLCVFESMASLDTNCSYVFGNIVVESGDEGYAAKLKMVERVFGTITIRNTDLESFNFIRSLIKVVNLDESLPAVQVLSNKNLKNFDLFAAEFFISRTNGSGDIVVSNNHPDIFKNTKSCLKLQYKTKTRILFNGATCQSVNKTAHSDSDFDFENPDYEELDPDTYGDPSDYAPWYEEYDGEFYYLTGYDDYIMFLEALINYIAVFGFLVNLLHLTILLQRELRGNFVYILMIGICLCDMSLVATFDIDYLSDVYDFFAYTGCRRWSVPYAIFFMAKDSIQAFARRCSSFLVFLMAVFRTLSMIYPMSSTISTLTRPRNILLIILAVFTTCFVWDFALLTRCEFQSSTGGACSQLDKDYSHNYFDCPRDSDNDGDIKYNKNVSLLSGVSSLIIGVLYASATIALLANLKKARRRRMSLTATTAKKQEGDSTVLLVSVMAVMFFICEILFGGLIVLRELAFTKYERLGQLFKQLQIVPWMLLILNSSIHCFICFLMSAQYREVVRRIVLCGRVSKVVPVVSKTHEASSS